MKPLLSSRVGALSHRDLSTGARVLSARKTLRVTYQEGTLCVSAEATPIPGFGRDDFDAAREAIHSIEAQGLQRLTAEVTRAFHADGGAEHRTSPFGTAHLSVLASTLSEISSPSARFCLEMLVLRAVAKRLGLPLYRTLCARPVAPALRTSAVLDPSDAAALSEARALFSRGVRTFKVKCGRDTDAELAFLADLAALSPELIRIRVDANGAWSLPATRGFLRGCASLPIEWFEDPTSSPDEWDQLGADGEMPLLAIDEPLLAHPSPDLAPIHALILKPMALGGVCECLKWARRAEELGKKVCISHFFDGTLAMEAYAALAFAIQSPEVAVGLGYHRALATAALEEVMGLATGELRLPRP